MKMLNKEECEKALNNLADLSCIRNYFANEYYKTLLQLIKEHFELVEKYNTLLTRFNALENPQPYKFEDLKEGMWVYFKDNNELVLIDFTTYNPETGERFVYFWVAGHNGVVRFEFEENRFFPVWMAKVR